MGAPAAETCGYSIFHETMADMTFPEVEQSARDGAVVLWGLGVIEQHGPHLPLGTDVYLPSAVLRIARRVLAEQGIPSVIAPPFYWGVNHVTGAFSGSFVVRPEIMLELLKDVFTSLTKDGFRAVFCLSGHGDALHNRTLFEAVRQGRASTRTDVWMIASAALARRLGLDPADPHIALAPTLGIAGAVPPASADSRAASTPAHLDVHAGEGETSMLLEATPGIVRSALLPDMRSTALGPADLAQWRKGADAAKRVTPLGYFGNPAAARAEHGAQLLEVEGRAVAAAVAATIRARPKEDA